MTSITILLAEDDALLRDVCIKKLSAAGFTVQTAEDGEQTLALLQKQAPDILLCDIHMPKVSGLDVLRQFPRTARSFPIVMLTNFDQPEFRLRCEELGADEYFVKKDMTIRTLTEMIERLLNGRKK